MRIILLFLHNMPIDEIESIREKYDPLFGLILSLYNNCIPFKVPFQMMSLKLHILNVCKGIHTIEIEFANRISSKGEYSILRS